MWWYQVRISIKLDRIVVAEVLDFSKGKLTIDIASIKDATRKYTCLRYLGISQKRTVRMLKTSII